MTEKVFISHAHKDTEAARELADKLSSKGIETWLDEYEIRPGESWEQQIKDALVESKTVVLVLGEGDPAPNVLVEAGMALGQGKNILPVVVAESANVDLFPNLQHVWAVSEDGIDAAADQIKSLVNHQDA